MKILVISDDPICHSGFSIVTTKILDACYRITDDVVLLGINGKSNYNIRKKDKKIVEGTIKFDNRLTYNKNIRNAINLVSPDIIIMHNDLNVMYEVYYGSVHDKFALCDIDNIKIGWIGPVDTAIPHRIDIEMARKLNFTMPYTLYGKNLIGASSMFRLGPSVANDVFLERNSHKSKKLLFIGRNHWKKKIPILCGIFKLYHDNYCSDAILTIKTDYASNLEQFMKYDCINIITKRMTDNEISDLYRNHDTYISLCPNEGWGIPLTDATFYNMKIITIDFPNHDEATGSVYGKIGTYDAKIFDGYRYIPIPKYTEANDLLLSYDEFNNKRISYWDESVDNLEKEIKRIL